MAEHPDEARNARGLERFLMFSDGVAAIAVTLLVLPLVDAVTDSDGEGESVLDIVSGMRWEMFSFALSFVVIVVLWLDHQRVFRNVAQTSLPIVRAGILWLFGIVSLSFSTALIADHADERLTVLIYTANLAVTMGALTFTIWYLHGHPELLHPGGEIADDELLDAWINQGLILLAFVLALVVPGLGFLVMLLMFLDRPIMRVIHRWRE
jgi:uncharacterized membrane protein